MKKFPVFKSVGEVFSGVTRHFLDLIWIARVPLCVYVAAYIAILLNNTGGPAGMRSMSVGVLKVGMPASWLSSWSNIGVFFLALIVLFVSIVAAAVHWHRFILLGERDGSLFGEFKIAYLLTSVKLVVFASLMLSGGLVMTYFPFSSILQLGLSIYGIVIAVCLVFGIYLAVLLWLVRASLALPQAALSSSRSIVSVWDKSEGNSWRLLGATLLIQLFAGLLYWVFNWIFAHIGRLALPSKVLQPQSEYVSTVSFIWDLVSVPLDIYVMMLGVTILSVAYREIIGLPAATAPDAESASV
ncbi:MAG: hypothetical protein Q7T44_09650 [Parvibaculum sp.]|nr:hypothetical protein [Parvibaculum sp.]